MDPLDRFSAALAAEHDGEVVAPGVTRSRILERLSKRRTPRSSILRRLWAVPLVMLGAGTALAASGRLPRLLEPVTQWLTEGGVLTPTSVQARRTPGRALAPVSPAAETASVSQQGALTPPTPEGGTDLAALESVASEGSPAPTGPRGPARAESERPKARLVAPGEASLAQNGQAQSSQAALARTEGPEELEELEAPAASEPGLATYAAAQRAHFRSKDCGTASRLYESYLESAPSGSFVTEARYNLSLCLVRLGRATEARPLLSAFASGAYGNYRRLEASRLLDAMAE